MKGLELIGVVLPTCCQLCDVIFSKIMKAAPQARAKLHLAADLAFRFCAFLSDQHDTGRPHFELWEVDWCFSATT